MKILNEIMEKTKKYVVSGVALTTLLGGVMAYNPANAQDNVTDNKNVYHDTVRDYRKEIAKEILKLGETYTALEKIINTECGSSYQLPEKLPLDKKSRREVHAKLREKNNCLDLKVQFGRYAGAITDLDQIATVMDKLPENEKTKSLSTTQREKLYEILDGIKENYGLK